LASRLTALRQAVPEATVELWAEDEHRLGLKPILRRVWAPRGQRPLALGHHRYAWTYLYAFAHPERGETAWLLLPRVSAELFSLALAHFAREVGAGPTRQILLVLDRAGFHLGAEVTVPEGIHLEFLPPYSPELQPAEHLWPLTNEAVANRHFADITALEDQMTARCRTLSGQPDLIRSQTRFHWWPTEEAA
jgi:transposase